MFASDDWQVYSPSALITALQEQQHTRLVLSYYQKTLLKDKRALHYLQQIRGLTQSNVIKQFSLGFSDRTLASQLPGSNSFESEAIKGLLQRNGLLKLNGHEAFRGMLIFPVFDENNYFIGAYGRRISKYGRKECDFYYAVKDEDNCLYHHEVLNVHERIVLCISPMEVITLWALGIKNAVSPLLIRDFSAQHVYRLIEAGITTVDMAFGNTPFAQKWYGIVNHMLVEANLITNKIRLAVGEDINSTFVKSKQVTALQQQFSFSGKLDA
jgi:DNA primase